MVSRESALHIIAPTFDPATVAGAGVSLVELTSRFLEKLPETRIYLNAKTAKAFPEWRDATVVVPSGSMASPWRKSLAVLRLQLFGFPNYPRDGVCWFPFGPMMPLSFRGRGVSTIHDTLDLDLQSFLPFSERIFRKVIMPRTVRHTVVVTDSNFSRERLKHHYNIDAVVIPLAVQTMPAASRSKVPASPYVFFPANCYAHKNHRFLIDLWKTRRELQTLSLVFTLGSGSRPLDGAIQAARMAGARIVITGRVGREELAGLYQNAICTALPTLYEGFGLPMQEALICNCPVLANDACPALVETVTPGYPHFLPLDPDRWSNAILALTNSPREDLRGYVRNRTWDDCARDYLELFARVGE